MKATNHYEIDAQDEDEALEKLGEHLERNNMTAETEFWDNLDIAILNVEE
jgi:predicted small metal-binding protein